MDDLVSEYPKCFEDIGNFEGTYHLVIDPNIHPVVHPPRRCPIALRDEVKATLDEMERLNVIKKVHKPTDWVSSLVYSRKSNGTIRICLDPKDLNTALKRPHYATRTLEEVTHHLAGATVFSKLDARSGYWSVHLDESSSFLTTFNSPFGRYRFLRLPFGLNLSQDVFQEKMDQILEKCPGTISIADDIGVFGNSKKQHDDNLRNLMEIAQKHGLVFNKSKCNINSDSLSFFGLHFSKDGVSPDADRIASIRSMPSPKNPQALREFLGVAVYMSPFTKNLATHTSPLRSLLKKDIDYIWSPSHEKAFINVKRLICQQTTLSYFDPSRTSTIQVDASGTGLGATLLQNDMPIAFASKSLSPAETRYANIEREMLAVVFGCERFHNYIYGTRFKVESDHQPLEMIIRKNLFAAPSRLQRMLLRIQQYDFKLIYRRGKEILIADALSRQPVSENQHIDLDVQIMPIQFSKERISKIEQDTKDDPTLQILKEQIIRGWPHDIRLVDQLIRPYWSFRDELTIHENLILKRQQILIPAPSRPQILKTLHIPHLGIVKTNALAKSHVYWPNMTEDITTLVNQCHLCQTYQNRQSKEPLESLEIPDHPWQVIATDLFYFNNTTYIIIADYYSKYPFVYPIKTQVTSTTIINILKTLFAEHGIPDKLISDNGRQYVSQDFVNFAKDWNFTHRTSSPYHQQSNGFAERHIQTIKQIMRKTTDIHMALLMLRTTPIANSTKSPAEIMFGRKINNHLPVIPIKDSTHHSTLLHHKTQNEKYYNSTNPRSLKPLEKLDKVYYRDEVHHNWKPATISNANDTPRSYKLQTETGTEIQRNRKDIRQSTDPAPSITTPEPSPPELRRSTRVSHPPDRYTS